MLSTFAMVYKLDAFTQRIDLHNVLKAFIFSLYLDLGINIAAGFITNVLQNINIDTVNFANDEEHESENAVVQDSPIPNESSSEGDQCPSDSSSNEDATTKKRSNEPKTRNDCGQVPCNQKSTLWLNLFIIIGVIYMIRNCHMLCLPECICVCLAVYKIYDIHCSLVVK